MTSWGPDVSTYQGAVDWAAVKRAGASFGIAKASAGSTIADPDFAASWRDMKNLHLRRIAYHFAYPSLNSASAEAGQFLRCLRAAGGWAPGDGMMLDLETGTGNLSGWALAWLQDVAGATKCRTWAYSYGPFIRLHLTDPRLATWPLHLADYQAAVPPSVPPWSSFALWQHTDAGAVPGIAGAVDLNNWMGGSVAALDTWLGSTPVPTEDDMPAIITPGGSGQWIVRADFSSKTELVDAADIAAAKKAGAVDDVLSAAQLAKIPVAGESAAVTIGTVTGTGTFQWTPMP